MNSDQERHGAHSLHGELSKIAVSVGRLEERQIAMFNALADHIRDEHEQFKEQHERAVHEIQDLKREVTTLKSNISELHSAAKTTRFIASAILGLAALWAYISTALGK